MFLLLIGTVKRRLRARYAVHWLLLSVIFLGLSIDEAASVHETILEIMLLKIFPSMDTTGYAFYPWVVVGVPFVIVVGASYLAFLSQLPAQTRNWFLAAGGLYVGGALGVELLGANYAYMHGRDNLPYALLVAVEESLELAGVIVFISALSSYLSANLADLRIAILAPNNEFMKAETKTAEIMSVREKLRMVGSASDN